MSDPLRGGRWCPSRSLCPFLSAHLTSAVGDHNAAVGWSGLPARWWFIWLPDPIVTPPVACRRSLRAAGSASVPCRQHPRLPGQRIAGSWLRRPCRGPAWDRAALDPAICRPSALRAPSLIAARKSFYLPLNVNLIFFGTGFDRQARPIIRDFRPSLYELWSLTSRGQGIKLASKGGR